MSWLQVVVLSVLQGLTEFLPVSSSGHLAIASRMFFDDDAGASFTAVTQLGTELAVLLYFARDIGRILKAWFNGLFVAAHRTLDYWMGWYVIIGTIPIGVFGSAVQGRNPYWRTQSVADRERADRLLRRHRRRRVLRQADPARRTAHAGRTASSSGWRSAWRWCPAYRGRAQRSARACSSGLDRELAARFGFLLAIPAVFASGLFSLPDAFHPVGEGMSASGPQLLVATVIAFVIGFAAVAWFLRFLVRHSMYWFVGYRVAARRGGADPAGHRGGVRDMTVILLRHGRSTSNTAHTLAGRTDGVDLDDKGREQAQAVVERLGRAADPCDRALAAAALPAHGRTAGRRARAGSGGRRAHLRGRLRQLDRSQDR